MKKLVKHILTDYDNATFDTGRTIAALFILSAMVYSGFDVLRNGHVFDPQAYLVGGGGFLAGLGMYLFGDGKGRRDYSGETTGQSPE